MRFVVTGTPGAGTRYVSELLTHAGITAGHESALHHGTADGGFLLQQCRYTAEVSWYAAPWLHLFSFPSVHLIRHPLDNIATLMAMPQWFDGAYQKGTLQRFSPAAYDLPPGPERFARFWLDWNRWADRADYRWHTHNITPSQIEQVAASVELHVDAADAVERTPQGIGHRNRNIRLSWADLGDLADETRNRAVEYGIVGGDGRIPAERPNGTSPPVPVTAQSPR